jgi:very-short-patch-repair endonuclease
MKRLPEVPCVTVPVKRRLTQSRRAGLELHWSQVEAGDLVDGWLTSPGRTFVDCCRDLPFDEALAVADSALRRQVLSPLDLARLASQMRGPGRTRADRVAKEATAAADNPFESVLRAIALDVPGLTVQPQVLVVEKPFAVRPDLVDEHLKLALEADSFEWHGSRAALRRDCRRYNLLVAHGWRVLRFTWEDVMLDPQNVRQTLVAAVAVVRGQEEVRPATALPA